jgi:hypothetical protein
MPKHFALPPLVARAEVGPTSKRQTRLHEKGICSRYRRRRVSHGGCLGGMVSGRVSRGKGVGDGCRRARLGCPLQKKGPVRKMAGARADGGQKREPKREPKLLLMSGVRKHPRRA